MKAGKEGRDVEPTEQPFLSRSFHRKGQKEGKVAEENTGSKKVCSFFLSFH